MCWLAFVAPLGPFLAFLCLALVQDADLYGLYHLGSQAAPAFQLASANGLQPMGGTSMRSAGGQGVRLGG